MRIVYDDGPEAFARLQAAALAAIDRAADERRAAVASPWPTQAAVYLIKERQAEQVIAGETDPAAVPLIQATVGIEGATLQEVAAVVLATRDAWMATASAIETVRLGAKRAAMEATTPPALRAVVAGIVWP